ncbi:hypothetical protein PF004_g29031 [Phytophthora fragariae]|uniref:Reverse transcriptase Ty1/copia-type domain-containing protein n=1 Tax=Phytophthora fragariae TaxID=53985 RepID=A0A6G0MHN9_9STRA|nr:hypothetical protein PF004_g29031 [Phytophthora fragariae]
MREARLSPQWSKWRRATEVEIRSLEANDTFELVPLPPGKTALNTTVQFRLKVDADGNVERYKARVCACGNLQVYLRDYFHTHAPVIDLVCVKIFLAFVVKFDMYVRQGDVPAAYIKAPLKEEVYVRQVRGFERPGSESLVWKLKKALYGLRQAGHEWNREIDKFLKEYGLQPTTGDACLYYKRDSDGLLLVCLYVDDILVAHQHKEAVLRLLTALSIKFQVKDLGVPTQFLGTKIQRTESGIELSQTTYVEEILQRFAMSPTRQADTPMVPNTRLEFLDEPSAQEVEEMSKVPYRQVVGCLLYLARVTRPDLSFSINQLARHCSKPRKAAWDAAKHVLRYLHHTKRARLELSPAEESVSLATDADWANDISDRKSISGFFIRVFGCPVHWGSLKQSVVTLSSTTAEFVAACEGLMQAEWISLVVGELLGDDVEPVIVQQVNNISAISRIKKDGSSNAQKAIDIRFHYVKDALKKNKMVLQYVPTSDNPADLLTKSLAKTELSRKRDLCGLCGATG